MSLVPAEYIPIGESKVKKAKEGFETLVNQFTGENLIAQITAAGKSKLIADAVRDVLFYGSNGSLWEAYVAVERVELTPEMAPFLTESRKQDFKNKLIEVISGL